MSRVVTADLDVRPADLDPDASAVIYRYTEIRHKGGDVVIPLPCHSTQTVVWRPWAAGASRRLAVICRTCERTYDMDMLSEHDGGWQAMFTFATQPVLLSNGKRLT